MSTNRKATMAKRQREMEQKDRVREREARRTERRSRIAARVLAGKTGPEIVPPPPPVAELAFDANGPRTLAELRARGANPGRGESDPDEDAALRDPDEMDWRYSI